MSRHSERRAALKADHKCIRCRDPLPDGYTTTVCQSCKDKNTAYKAQRRKKAAESQKLQSHKIPTESQKFYVAE